ncbi:MAG: hypothetical protein ACRCT1_01655 [Microcoleaceae cyanobacterium]
MSLLVSEINNKLNGKRQIDIATSTVRNLLIPQTIDFLPSSLSSLSSPSSPSSFFLLPSSFFLLL